MWIINGKNAKDSYRWPFVDVTYANGLHLPLRINRKSASIRVIYRELGFISIMFLMCNKMEHTGLLWDQHYLEHFIKIWTLSSHTQIAQSTIRYGAFKRWDDVFLLFI